MAKGRIQMRNYGDTDTNVYKRDGFDKKKLIPIFMLDKYNSPVTFNYSFNSKIN